MIENKSKSELVSLFELNNKELSKIIKYYVDTQLNKQRKALSIDKLLAFFALIVFVLGLYFGLLVFKTETQKTQTNSKFDLTGYELAFIEQRGKKLCTGFRRLGTIEQYYTYCSPNKK